MDSTTVALGHLIRYWAWTDVEVGLLLIDIWNGKMVPAGVLKSGRGVCALMFHVDRLNHWFSGKQRVPCAELTIPDIALRIGVKQEVAYALVRSGLLQATFRKVGRRSEQRVEISILEEFERRYILGRDIARSLHRSPRAVAEFLLAGSVRPVAGPSVNNCRQIVFNRIEVDEFLRSNGLEMTHCDQQN